MLRGFGLLYIVGGLFGVRQAWFWGRLEPQMDQLLDMMDQISADNEGKPTPAPRVTDNARNWWLLTGCVMLVITGVFMALAHRAAVILLALVVLHQMAYFIRQRRRELDAPNAEQAEEARPQQSTINGFFTALAVTVLAAGLYYRDALA